MPIPALPAWLRHPPVAVAGIVIALIVFALVAGLRGSGGMQAIELATYDLYVELRPEPEPLDERLTVILIDDADIRRVAQWPLSDATLADLLERLLAARPLVLGVDLYRDLPVAPGTGHFDDLITRNEALVFAMKFGGADSARVPPPRVLANSDRVGFVDLLVDPGGYVRRGLLFLDDGAAHGTALALQLALRYFAAHGVIPVADDANPNHIRLGNVTYRPLESHDGSYVAADSAGYQYLLDYRGGARPFRSYSMSDVLDGRVPPEHLRDRIVMIGVTADSVKDFFLTPFSRNNDTAFGMPGVLVHAHATSQLLRAGLNGERPMHFLPENAEHLTFLLAALLGVATALRLRTLLALSFAAVLLAGGLVGGTFVAFLAGWWLPVAPVALSGFIGASLAAAYLSNHERNEKRYLMDIFARQVSPDVAAQMWQQRDRFLSGGRLEPQLLTASVLFTDLRDFTPVAEQLTPTELMEWLNRYMGTMAGLVMQHGGVVDDFFGDAIKANFGVPIARTDPALIADDARRAVRCALAMGDALADMNRQWQAEGLPQIRMRAGIATGAVVAGCLGSTQRMKFTTLGDIVNTAARLETYGKDDPDITADNAICRILIAGETANQLDKNEHQMTEVGALQLKGKQARVGVFSVTRVASQDSHAQA